jgi:hypothetical protein
MIVAILTIEQKEQLQGQQYATDSYFNPIQDLNNNWVISQEEIEQNTNVDFSWLANLKLVEHLPKNNNI